MAAGRLLDRFGDVTSTFHYDHATDKYAIERSQNSGPYLAQNARCRSDSAHTGDFRLKMSITNVMFEKLLRDKGMTYYQFKRMDRKSRDTFLARIFNDRDFYKLRTTEKTRKASFSGDHAPKLILPGA